MYNNFLLICSANLLFFLSSANQLFFLSSAVQSGCLLLDSSTIDPAMSREMDKLATDKGATYMDAPVSGGGFLH